MEAFCAKRGTDFRAGVHTGATMTGGTPGCRLRVFDLFFLGYLAIMIKIYIFW